MYIYIYNSCTYICIDICISFIVRATQSRSPSSSRYQRIIPPSIAPKPQGHSDSRYVVSWLPVDLCLGINVSPLKSPACLPETPKCVHMSTPVGIQLESHILEGQRFRGLEKSPSTLLFSSKALVTLNHDGWWWCPTQVCR